MSRGFKTRLSKLEASQGIGGRLYVYALRFGVGMCDESTQTPEFRYLILDDGTDRGRMVRQLAPMEILEGIPGGETPWIVNPDYEPDPAVRERHKQEAYAREGRDRTGAYKR